MTLQRRTPLARRTPLQPGKPLARRTALAPVGARAKRRNPELRAAYQATDARSAGRCEAHVAGVCTGAAVDHHHLAKRSTHPELVTDPSNIIHVCRACHTWIDDNQPEAARLGLHRPRKAPTP